MGVNGYPLKGLDRYAVLYFWRMHDRVTIGKSPGISWPRNREGYIAFCEEIGPIPAQLKKPSVGRIDHARGYEPGNVRWEEHAINSVKRRGTRWEGSTEEVVPFRDLTPSFRRGTPEHLAHQSKASLIRWHGKDYVK